MSCKTKLPTKSDTELSNAGSNSLENHYRTIESVYSNKKKRILKISGHGVCWLIVVVEKCI
jgi:hypothetical protein